MGNGEFGNIENASGAILTLLDLTCVSTEYGQPNSLSRLESSMLQASLFTSISCFLFAVGGEAFPFNIETFWIWTQELVMSLSHPLDK